MLIQYIYIYSSIITTTRYEGARVGEYLRYLSCYSNYYYHYYYYYYTTTITTTQMEVAVAKSDVATERLTETRRHKGAAVAQEVDDNPVSNLPEISDLSPRREDSEVFVYLCFC